jgi:hypothetical protein
MVKDWKSRAEKGDVSISKFVIERVEEAVGREEGEASYLGRVELIKKLSDAEEELKKVRNENMLLRKLAENLGNELRRYSAQPFLEEAFEGSQKI